MTPARRGRRCRDEEPALIEKLLAGLVLAVCLMLLRLLGSARRSRTVYPVAVGRPARALALWR